MKNRIICTALVCVMIVAMLCSCKSKTSKELDAASLLKEVQENTAQLDSVEMDMVMELSMDVGLLGTYAVELDMDIMSTTDPYASYTYGSVGLLGMNIETEVYTIVEDDMLCTYTYMYGEWLVAREAYDAASIASYSDMGLDFLMNLDSLELAKKTESVNGTEVYIITGSVTGDDVLSAMLGGFDSLWESLLGTDSMELSGFSVDFTYAISVEEKLPVYIKMEFDGFEFESQGMSFGDVSCTITYTGYNTVSLITLPEAAMDAAEA